jgi:deoxyribonuclease V
MKLCLDVGYHDDEVVTACVGFTDWPNASPVLERVLRSRVSPPAYQSGQFFRRELPFLLDVLQRVAGTPELVIIDGHVWLDGDRPGLGAHLHESLGGATPVIGVAKRPFRNATACAPVLRGSSLQPLFVSAVGLELAVAVAGIRGMDGAHRIPTLLKRVDRLSRSTG